MIGASIISGFIAIPIYFDMSAGLVELSVEAYVVKGMTTPFILGNDFARQYALSIVRSNEGTQLVFVDMGRKSWLKILLVQLSWMKSVIPSKLKSTESVIQRR